MAGRIRLRGKALAWKRCSPGSDATVHGPVSIGSTESMPCSNVALAQLVTQGVRALPSGLSALGCDCLGHLIGLLENGLSLAWDRRGSEVLTHIQAIEGPNHAQVEGRLHCYLHYGGKQGAAHGSVAWINW